MLKNLLKITFRIISRNKGIVFLNISGLAIGLAAALLILLWVQDELSYEKFNEKAGNIYRVEEDQFYTGRRYHVTVTPHPSGPEWKQKIPEIIDQTRINRMPKILFRQGSNLFFENQIVAADSGLYKIFTLPFVSGDPVTALRAPNSIVLTEKLAAKYFGNDNPIGKTILVENKFEFTVTGVMKDLPKNTMFTFEGVVPFSFLNLTGLTNNSWGSNSILTFVLLTEGADIQNVNKKLTDVVLEHIPQTRTKFVLFPLTDIHLHGQFGFEESKGPVISVIIFTLIAVFVLLIACINFINLLTAKASARTREIVIKKVAGADQKMLALQFMLESFMMVLISLVLAGLLVALSLETFNSISGKRFELSDLINTRFVLGFILIGLFAGFISGIYPALYLSSIRPLAVLKGETLSGKGNGRMRQVLVVVQFTLSILIAILAVSMFLQLKFLQDKELGFDKNNLICIPMPEAMKPKYYSLKSELQNEPLVLGVTASRSNPVMIGSNSGGADWDGKDPDSQVLIGTNAVDYDYLETMRMSLRSGRDFSRDHVADMVRDTLGNFLVNEEVAKLMETEDPVGRNFQFMGLSGNIVGVLENFHFKGADKTIEPMAFALTPPQWLNFMLVRLAPENMPEALRTVEKAWNKIIPEYPLEYTFTDQDYNNLYRGISRITDLLKHFTILALVIACMGLYGLASFISARRTKEAGLRKVLGASSLSIIYTLTKEFLLLVLISNILALPAGWIITRKLLGEFANHIEPGLLVFLLTGLVSFVVALIAVSYQAWRASNVNPAQAVRTE